LKLDDLFTYDVLVGILRIRVNDLVKSAAVRLVHYLYVDRYPQSAIPVPRLSRS